MILDELLSSDEDQAEAVVQLVKTASELERQSILEQVCIRLEAGCPGVDERWWALRLVAEVPDDRSFYWLLRGLHDEDPGIRQCAALGLRRDPNERAIPELISALADPDSLCADLVADTLIQIGQPAVPELLRVMKEGEQAVRVQAVRALALIGDVRSIPALNSALLENSPLMEYWAKHGLERLN